MCGLHRREVGSDISRLYVNGVNSTVAMASVPHGEWCHVYIEAAYSFDDDVNLFSATISGDEYSSDGRFMKGRLANAIEWGRAVPLEEVAQMAQVASTRLFEFSYWNASIVTIFLIEEGACGESARARPVARGRVRGGVEF